ncbi:MAG: coproporphyrinogen III oxidase family protein [Fibrobacter sp.]|nr:coproporphyrinogen III oxidase family protein [Fibrobacter sp.]
MPAFTKLFQEYTDLLCAEIVQFERTRPGLLGSAETLYLGGGTPSILPFECLQQIFGCLSSVGVDISRMREVSMEFNPESTSDESIENAKQLGVNRISLGLQTFDPNLLKLVGRSHSVQMGLSALEKLTSTKGIQVSGDLMFNLPRQSVQGFLDDVDRLSDLSLNHISFYGLTVSPRTRLGHRIEQGELSLDEDCYEPMYMGGVELLDRKGFKRYEVSNFARPGFESVHNKNYWNRGEYMGFGPGAHSFVGNTRFYAPEMYPRWREYVVGGCPAEGLSVDELDEDAVMEEWVWLSLRQSSGLDLGCLEKRGFCFSESAYGKWIDRGFLACENLEKQGGRTTVLKLVNRGWLFMDDIATDLMNQYSKME